MILVSKTNEKVSTIFLVAHPMNIPAKKFPFRAESLLPDMEDLVLDKRRAAELLKISCKIRIGPCNDLLFVILHRLRILSSLNPSS